MSQLIAKAGINRRMALKVMMVMGLGTPSVGRSADATLAPRPGVHPQGTLTDPDLKHPQIPWHRTLSEDALGTLAALADLILPADARSPAASTLGAHDFIDEWVSAPYQRQQADRSVLLDGLEWLGKESKRRFGAAFVDLTADQQTSICDEICDPARAAPDLATGTAFFKLARDLTATAVWTTEEGMADLGYVGNVPLTKWSPPPAAVLEHLGLKQT